MKKLMLGFIIALMPLYVYISFARELNGVEEPLTAEALIKKIEQFNLFDDTQEQFEILKNDFQKISASFQPVNRVDYKDVLEYLGAFFASIGNFFVGLWQAVMSFIKLVIYFIIDIVDVFAWVTGLSKI